MGFFDDLVALANEVKQPIQEVVSTVNDTQSAITDTAQQLKDEASSIQADVGSTLQGVRDAATDGVNNLQDTIKGK